MGMPALSGEVTKMTTQDRALLLEQATVAELHRQLREVTAERDRVLALLKATLRQVKIREARR